jgi:predicted ATPase/DNA-binding CsgD family transcriptional regulator
MRCALVAHLLTTCPALTVLATSRVRLGISGEQVLPLPPLDEETARILFAKRAEAANPGFVVSLENASVVDAICDRLDRLPLAIELAAARTNVLPPRALLARLDQRLDLLSGGPRDAPDRQRDMRAAIAWSHDLLPEAEQRLFRRLGVFVGGFTLDAAGAVAGDGCDVLAGVSALVAASLVIPATAVGDEARFAMLETIREYALERLAASGDLVDTQQRHAVYYRCLTEAALPFYAGPEVPVYRERIHLELDNCRAAMSWALDHDAAETGVRLAGALWTIWATSLLPGETPGTERVTEGRAWCERMLAKAGDLPVEALTEALAGTSFLAAMLGDNQRACAAGEDLLARAQAQNDAYGLYWAHQVLGNAAEVQGSNHAPVQGSVRRPVQSLQSWDALAQRHYEAALVVAPTIRNPDNHMAQTLSSLGVMAHRQGDLERAAGIFDEALVLCRRTGNPFGLVWLLVSSVRVLREQGQRQHAVALLREALVVLGGQPSLGDQSAALVLVELARITMEAGRHEHAVRLLGLAYDRPLCDSYRETIDPLIANARTNLGGPAFVAAWEAGRHLSWKEILTEVDALTADADGASQSDAPDGLTPRETEVLRLLAEGRSNRAIGDALSISERTVEVHVLHILAKLGLDSRTAAATWAVRRGLD